MKELGFNEEEEKILKEILKKNPPKTKIIQRFNDN